MTGQPSSKEVVDDESPALLYAVYCVAELPVEIITEFIQKTRHQDFPILIASKDAHLSSYSTSTHLPLYTFESPFLGYTIGSITTVYREQILGLDSRRYGTRNFVILDERTISDKTCLIVHLGLDQLQTLRSDFDMALECFIGSEVMAWGFDEMQLAPFFHNGITVTRELYERVESGEYEDLASLFGNG